MGISGVCVVLVVWVTGVELFTGSRVRVTTSHIGISRRVIAVCDRRDGWSVRHMASNHGRRASREVVVAKFVIEESSRTTELGGIEMLIFHTTRTHSADNECNDDCNHEDTTNSTGNCADN